MKNYVTDVSDFKVQVLEKSNELPVLADFWAPWCQPCRILGPVLEEIAEGYEGKMVLAKIDTHKYPEVAVTYQIRGIPAVKLFIKGKPAMEFTGVMPKIQIIKMLEKFIPDDNKVELENIRDSIGTSPEQEICRRLEELVGKAPELVEARLMLAKAIIFDNPVKSMSLLDDIYEDSPFYQQSASNKTLAGLLNMNNKDLEEGPLKEMFIVALDALKNKDFEKALDNFIHLIIMKKSYMDELARKACVAIFNYLGNDHKISRAYRRRFDTSLY